ncbi:MAG: hypothetical protein SGBAC_013026, partial [Bacillariaceae sp.]
MWPFRDGTSAQPVTLGWLLCAGFFLLLLDWNEQKRAVKELKWELHNLKNETIRLDEGELGTSIRNGALALDMDTQNLSWISMDADEEKLADGQSNTNSPTTNNSWVPVDEEERQP